MQWQQSWQPLIIPISKTWINYLFAIWFQRMLAHLKMGFGKVEQEISLVGKSLQIEQEDQWWCRLPFNFSPDFAQLMESHRAQIEIWRNTSEINSFKHCSIYKLVCMKLLTCSTGGKSSSSDWKFPISRNTSEINSFEQCGIYVVTLFYWWVNFVLIRDPVWWWWRWWWGQRIWWLRWRRRWWWWYILW